MTARAAILAALAAVALVAGTIVGAWLTYEPDPPTPQTVRCVVLPLRGGGGLVTDCQPERRT